MPRPRAPRLPSLAALLACALPVAAQQARVVTPVPGAVIPGAAGAIGAALPGLSSQPGLLSPLSLPLSASPLPSAQAQVAGLSLTPAFPAVLASDLALPAPAAVGSMPGAIPAALPAASAEAVAAAPAVAGSAAPKAARLSASPGAGRPLALPGRPGAERVGQGLAEGLREVSAELGRHSDRGGSGSRAALDKLFSKGRGRDAAESAPRFVVNDEGLHVAGKAASYYKEVRRVVDRYQGRVDLRESLDVMDDSYAEVWSKLRAIEAIAKSRGISRENTHLEETLLWVDGVLQQGARRVAVHTHRVYFHHAQNPRSEIEEGIRRAGGYLDETLALFARRGEAEQALGGLDEVVLAFDTRGYAEIKEYLKGRERLVAAKHGARFRFEYVDELAPTPQDTAAMRRELDALTLRYEGDGLSKIIEGVVYSRYVGLLLELKTLAHLVDRGWTILQSGRELFDEKGLYVTELDVVARSPQGKVSLIEAKSARVRLPPDQVLQDKVVRKLETYRSHRAQLEAAIGAPVDEVVFSIDVGPNLELTDYLRGQERALTQRFGFPVRFLFLQSGPQDSLPKPGRRNRR